MLHACFRPIALCFVYTSWRFYAFSGTNLLTRCHSASSCFLLFWYFRKVIQQIFLELDKTKAKVPIYLTRRWSPNGRRRPSRRRPHHRVARPHPWPRQAMVCPPGRPLASPFHLYIHLIRKTLRPEPPSTETTVSLHRRQPEIGRVQKLFRHPAG
jgi:hypothetical protein